jgi:probable F420-dependent oxidoreductase
MKFGLCIPTLTGFARESEPSDGGWRARWKNSFEICELAEESQFNFATIGHHRFSGESIDSPQPLVALAALAARTTKLRLCTNIKILPLHHPVDVAEQAAMLDEISDGRVILGVGLGYRPYEFEQIGLDYKTRISRFEEAIEIIRRSWRPEPVFFEGRHFAVMGANVSPKPVQIHGPPIWIGAQADAAIARAARLGDGWLTDSFENIAALAPKAIRFREEARAAGRGGTVVLNRKIGISHDLRWLEEIWLPPVLEACRNYHRLGAPMDPVFAAKLISGAKLGIRDLPSNQIIAGTPEDCIAAIEECISGTNCDYIIIDFGRAAHGRQYVEIRDQIELFGRKVMPNFHHPM